jgi:hypothetical protein
MQGHLSKKAVVRVTGGPLQRAPRQIDISNSLPGSYTIYFQREEKYLDKKPGRVFVSMILDCRETSF